MGNLKKRLFVSSEWGYYFAGVYCVCTRLPDKKIKVWYVGSAKVIATRLTDPEHPLRVLRSKGFEPYLRCYETEDYRKIEKRLISLLNPPMNKQHRRIVFN